MQKVKSNKLLCLCALTIAFIIVFCSLAGTFGFVVANASTVEITVFSWEDYIDEGYDSYDEASELLRDRFTEEELTSSLIDIFEEQTGIKVNYYSFATNEEMYNELKKDTSAVNLICPSEYMILKMRNEDLIKPYEMPQNYKAYGSEYIKGVFDGLDLNAEGDKTYATGYMWGTMGLIYDAEKYTDADFESWTDLYDEKFSGRLTIKDSLRDSYIMALAIVYKDELLALDKNASDYNTKLSAIFNRTDKETVDKVENVLIDLKDNLYGFEVDAGKNDLLTGKIDVNFAWSGDAVYSMYEGDNINKKLGYVVPKEGSNVWFDGFVMTKGTSGEKEKASIKFLNFLADPKIAVRNIEYVGYTSCIAGDYVFDYVNENFGDDAGDKTVDLGYFFGTSSDYTIKVSTADDGYARHLFAQYADKETIARCAVMNNFTNEELERVNEMWNNVKLITLPVYAIVLICVGVVLIILLFVGYKYKDKLFKNIKLKEKTNKNRTKYKVVKIEERR